MSVNAHNEWVRCFRPEPSAPVRLLCLPHAGGSAGYFHPVAQQLGARVEVLAVQYPGRQDRHTEPCLESVAELADHVAELVRAWEDKPLALFGHSMGASVAFETARQMEARGSHPVLLIASGRRAPSAFRDERVHQGDDAALLAEMRRLGGTDPRLLQAGDVLRLAMPAIRADYKAAETYRYQPGPKLSVPIHALTGDADPKTTLDEVRKWEEHTTGTFDMTVYAGGHFFLSDHAAAVTRQIGGLLAPFGAVRH